MWKIDRQYRYKKWDYRNSGYYFITICTKHRYKIFGYIQNQEMILSDIGKIVEQEWIKTGKIRPYVELDEWIIMPDHFHALIKINDKRDPNEPRPHEPRRSKAPPLTYGAYGDNGIDKKTPFINGHKYSPKPKSLSSIIGSFKSIVTKKAHLQGFDGDIWQARFHDRIVRDTHKLENVRRYIKNNVKNHDKTLDV